MDKIEDLLIATDFFPKIGGAHYWLYQIYRNWPKKVLACVQDYKNDAALTDLQIQFDKSDHGALELRRLDFSLDSVSLFRLGNLLKIWNVSRLLANITKCSVSRLHILRIIPDGYFAIFAKLLSSRDIKLIFYAHGEEFLVANTSREFRLFAKMALKKADLVIANSYFTEQQVRKFFPEARVEVVHLGVNYSDFQVPASKVLAYRQKWGFPENTVVFLTVSRMEPRKNHAQVFNVLAQLLREGLSVGYVIIGTGEEEERLKRLAKSLDISDRIHFLGRVSEEEKILAFNAADVFVMPSIQLGPMTEGFGIVFLEAAAAGLPSVAGNVGGQPEAVLHGNTGLVVDGTNVKELYSALRYLVLNPKVRKDMGEKGRKWAKQHDWKNISQKVYNIISSFCREP